LPHQWQADTLLLSLLAGGSAALLLSTILVATMLNNLFIQQIPQIGIMKAIGARSVRIGRLYLTMTLTVATAATLLALGPAVLLGRVAVGQFLGFLGIHAASLAAPWWTYVVVLAVGPGLPPLLALPPLVKASRTTVRAAIDHHEGGAHPSAAAGMLARLGRLRRLDRGLLMALRNTVRRPGRFWLSVGLLATAGMVFVSGMSLSAGTEAVTNEQTKQRSWDVDMQLANPASMERIITLVEQLPDVSRVEGFNVTPTGLAGPGQIPITRTYPDQGHGRVQVTALPKASTMFTVPKLLEGRWLTAGETGAVVLNQITRCRQRRQQHPHRRGDQGEVRGLGQPKRGHQRRSPGRRHPDPARGRPAPWRGRRDRPGLDDERQRPGSDPGVRGHARHRRPSQGGAPHRQRRRRLPRLGQLPRGDPPDTRADRGPRRRPREPVLLRAAALPGLPPGHPHLDRGRHPRRRARHRGRRRPRRSHHCP
jgi:hypothetical protein